MAEICELHRLGEHEAAGGLAVQGLKACHQYGIDGGTWKKAWPLTTLKDPFVKDDFSGTYTELDTVVGMLEAREKLQNLLGRGLPENDTAEDDEEVPARRGRRRADPKKAATKAEKE